MLALFTNTLRFIPVAYFRSPSATFTDLIISMQISRLTVFAFHVSNLSPCPIYTSDAILASHVAYNI